MSAQWINTVGLVADIIGVSLLAWGLFASKKTAIELGATRWAGKTDDEGASKYGGIRRNVAEAITRAYLNAPLDHL